MNDMLMLLIILLLLLILISSLGGSITVAPRKTGNGPVWDTEMFKALPKGSHVTANRPQQQAVPLPSVKRRAIVKAKQEEEAATVAAAIEPFTAPVVSAPSPVDRHGGVVMQQSSVSASDNGYGYAPF